MTRLFLSYCHADKALVDSLRVALEARQVARVAFVSVEHITQPQAILDAIGGQRIPGYSAVISGGTGSTEEK